MNPLILALDTDNLETASRWIEATNDSISTYKVGLEFFLTFGKSGISSLRNAGDFDLFLDLKFHDIPNTVGKAAGAVADISPKFLTVHASGGEEMIAAAAQAAPRVSITAVTILTSLSSENLREIGFENPPLESAVNLAVLAVSAGAKAIVCSPLEVSAIRDRVGREPVIITPGVRPLGSDSGDQVRTMSPKDAMVAGSTYLVIGRPITSLYSQGVEAMRSRAREILDEATSS
jgi:orotidine-5'-phosphate decarboxylase